LGVGAPLTGVTRSPASHATGTPDDPAIPPETFARLRTAYEVIRVTDMMTVQELADPAEEIVLAAVRAAVTDAVLPEIPEGMTFAARCLRDGRHAVQSPTIEREAGTIIGRRTGAAVNLTAPDVTIRVDISSTLLVLGEVVGAQALDRRFEWMYRPRITLSTVVAAAALYLADMPDPENPVIHRVARRGGLRGARNDDSAGSPAGALLDPFCGSGTIAIEAASWSTEREAPIYASDLAPEAVAGTRANAACNGFFRRIVPRRGDATQLARYYRNRGITAIVCNPPFGVRLGKRINFDQFYQALLSEAAEVLPPAGRLVLLSSRRRGRLNAVIARSAAWRISAVYLIETGGVFPGIFVLERKERGPATR